MKKMYQKIKGFLYKHSGSIALVSGIVTMGCAAYLFWSIGSQFKTPTFGLHATAVELTKALTNIQKIIMAVFLTNVSICAYAGEIYKAKCNAKNQDASLDAVTVEQILREEDKEIKNVRLLNEELRPLLNSYPNSRNNISINSDNNSSAIISGNEHRPRYVC